MVRAGTVNQFDSMNPFVAFSALSYIVFTNIYPTLVEYNTQFKIRATGRRTGRRRRTA